MSVLASKTTVRTQECYELHKFFRWIFTYNQTPLTQTLTGNRKCLYKWGVRIKRDEFSENGIVFFQFPKRRLNFPCIKILARESCLTETGTRQWQINGFPWQHCKKLPFWGVMRRNIKLCNGGKVVIDKETVHILHHIWFIIIVIQKWNFLSNRRYFSMDYQ